MRLHQAQNIITNSFQQQQKTIRELQQRIKENNKKIEEQKTSIQQIDTLFQQKRKNLINIVDETNKIKSNIERQSNSRIESIQKRVSQFERLTQNGLQNYVNNLEKAYQSADAGYAEKMSRLQDAYTEAAADLNKLKETRKAAYEAILKQQEVKQNKTNYCLIPSAIELEDIHSLERIKSSLHKPRILSMLIWQTYWQPIAKKQFPIIIQSKTKTGIYKITNLQTNQCYIGQAIDIYKRWNQHCKAGLGIDTPVGNKLYKAIQEYGLQNFAFEILLQCPAEQLNEKEKYFIEFYQSDLYGYNGQGGNKR